MRPTEFDDEVDLVENGWTSVVTGATPELLTDLVDRRRNQVGIDAEPRTSGVDVIEYHRAHTELSHGGLDLLRGRPSLVRHDRQLHARRFHFGALIGRGYRFDVTRG